MTAAMESEWSKTLSYAIGLARSSKRRQSVYGYRLPGGGWGWNVQSSYHYVPNRNPASSLEIPRVESRKQFDEIMRGFPRCAATSHVGGSKVALICGEALAGRLAVFLTKNGKRSHFYRCKLPAPAIGPHYHLASGRRR